MNPEFRYSSFGYYDLLPMKGELNLIINQPRRTRFLEDTTNGLGMERSYMNEFAAITSRNKVCWIYYSWETEEIRYLKV